jgi:hypothetical protein
VRHFVRGVLATLMAQAALIVIIWFVMLPRLDWGANQDPGVVEETLANDSLRRWAHSHADSTANPYAPTAENLKAARVEYNEHCAAASIATCVTTGGRSRSDASWPRSSSGCLSGAVIG